MRAQARTISGAEANTNDSTFFWHWQEYSSNRIFRDPTLKSIGADACYKVSLSATKL
jgi:hypothetical protein